MLYQTLKLYNFKYQKIEFKREISFLKKQFLICFIESNLKNINKDSVINNLNTYVCILKELFNFTDFKLNVNFFKNLEKRQISKLDFNIFLQSFFIELKTVKEDYLKAFILTYLPPLLSLGYYTFGSIFECAFIPLRIRNGLKTI